MFSVFTVFYIYGLKDVIEYITKVIKCKFELLMNQL